MFRPNPNVIKRFQSPVSRELENLEEALALVLDSDVSLVNEICRYLANSPGKRIRPTLLFLSGKTSGSNSDGMLTAGTAVELIHTATLIHDDIIDDHNLRRGRATVKAQWGRDIATIMGDYLYSKAFACLGKAGMFDIMGILANVTHIMSAGEMLQFQLKRQIDVSEESYMEMILKKTASLFSASSECGATLGSGGNGDTSIYSKFGECVGLAFQITDDLFDYMALDSDLGKSTGADLNDGRVTLPFIAAYRNAPEVAKKKITGFFKAHLDNQDCRSEIIDFMKEYGGIEYSIQLARRLCRKAKEHINILASSPEKDALWFAADYVVDRVLPFTA
jgi:octaprenyl-diphosphate synthase